MSTPSLQKNNSVTIYLIAGGDKNKKVHTFSLSIRPKGNIMAQVSFELAYSDTAV